MENSNFGKKLKELFYQPSGYYSLKQLQDEVIRLSLNIPKDEVKKWYSSQELVQRLRKEPKKIKTYHRYTIHYPNYEHQIDILYMPTDKYNGKEYKYMLNVIDVYSRYLMCICLGDKTTTSVIDGLKKGYKENKYLKQAFIMSCDRGLEFDSKEFYDEFSKDSLIKIIEPNDYGKKAIIERVNRTITEKIFTNQYADEFNTNKKDSNKEWVLQLDSFVTKYNNTLHSSIGITPIEAITGQIQVIQEHRIVEDDIKIIPDNTKVRIAIQKKRINRATDPKWSERVYTVISSKKDNEEEPRLYRLSYEDKNGIIKSSTKAYYYEELKPIDTIIKPPRTKINLQEQDIEPIVEKPKEVKKKRQYKKQTEYLTTELPISTHTRMESKRTIKPVKKLNL